MYRLVVALLVALASLTASADPVWIQLDTVVTPGTPEGIWRMAGDCIFKISPRPGSSGVYDLTLCHGGDLSVKTGTYFGTMRAGADRYTYDASLLADPKAFAGNGKSRRRDFVITFDNSFSNLKIKHYSKGLVVNFMRLLPYLFRVSIEKKGQLPDGIVGASRCDGNSFDFPISL